MNLTKQYKCLFDKYPKSTVNWMQKKDERFEEIIDLGNWFAQIHSIVWFDKL